jgi:hypothetical protein
MEAFAMNDVPAATQGSFADFKLVKTRKTAQIIIEVPIEEADKALQALGGLPQPMSETWVAIARLETKQRVVPLKPDNTKLSFEAALRCREPLFQRYLGVPNEDEAAKSVRRYCGISSRAGLNTDPKAAMAWRTLDAQFLAWRAA